MTKRKFNCREAEAWVHDICISVSEVNVKCLQKILINWLKTLVWNDMLTLNFTEYPNGEK